MVFLKILNAPLRPVFANPVTFYKHYAYPPAYINILVIVKIFNFKNGEKGSKVKKYANELKIKKVWKQVRNQKCMETS